LLKVVRWTIIGALIEIIANKRDSMSTTVHVPKFRRAKPAVRREALVEATLRSLKEFGHEGVSLRNITTAAGVSVGLINHYYPNKSGLIAETYQTLAVSLQDSAGRQAENEAMSPRDRLSDFLNASFSPEILDPQLFKVWIVFWSMVAHSPEMLAVHDRTYARYRSRLESLLAKLISTGAAPPFKLKPAAIALLALLDGLWVELSLSPAIFKPKVAIALCEDWVDALCCGAFPRLLTARTGKTAGSTSKRARN
jgi:AcrR family transcriptional regulator